MNIVVQIENRASSRWGKHEGESSFGLCDRLSRTRDNSQRQLPTDQDYAVPTREYQTDQSSIKTAPAAARSVLEKTQRQLQKPHRFRSVDRVTPYQGDSLIEARCFRIPNGLSANRKLPFFCSVCAKMADAFTKLSKRMGTSRLSGTSDSVCIPFPPCLSHPKSYLVR